MRRLVFALEADLRRNFRQIFGFPVGLACFAWGFNVLQKVLGKYTKHKLLANFFKI